MEASHFRDLDHPSKYRRLDRSRFRRIFIQCQMRARMQIVLKIRFQNPTERTFVEHHNVIEADSSTSNTSGSLFAAKR